MGKLLPVAEFVDEPNDAARSSLAAYFHPGAFTGSSFERFARPGLNHFTSDDVVAVSMLSVNLPAPVSRWVLGAGVAELAAILDQIDPSLRIEDAEADLLEGSPTYQLWERIRRPQKPWGMGETKTSKLLATKRPNLFPVFDRHVAKALGLSKFEYWKPWQEFMRSSEGRRCSQLVIEMAGELGIEGVSVLRLFDVIVWIRQHGYRYITRSAVDEGYMVEVNYASPQVNSPVE